MEFPLNVKKITHPKIDIFQDPPAGFRCGEKVAVHPLEKVSNKSYSGVLLGEMATGISAEYDNKSQALTVKPEMHLSAIFVPELQRLVFALGHTKVKPFSEPNDPSKSTLRTNATGSRWLVPVAMLQPKGSYQDER